MSMLVPVEGAPPVACALLPPPVCVAVPLVCVCPPVAFDVLEVEPPADLVPPVLKAPPVLLPPPREPTAVLAAPPSPMDTVAPPLPLVSVSLVRCVAPDDALELPPSDARAVVLTWGITPPVLLSVEYVTPPPPPTRPNWCPPAALAALPPAASESSPLFGVGSGWGFKSQLINATATTTAHQ